MSPKHKHDGALSEPDVPLAAADEATLAILRHWREAVPNDRSAHLVKDAMRGLMRALQMRQAKHAVSFGHWSFLRILWERDGLPSANCRSARACRSPPPTLR